MTDEISKGTAQGLMDYLESLIDKGRAPKGSVRLLITAVKAILTKTEGEDAWPKVKILELDTEDTMSRFKNLTLGSYREESYITYQSRFSKAIDWYQTFLANPGWVPKTRERSNKISQQQPSTKRVEKNINVNKQSHAESNESGDVLSVVGPANVIAYPFPLKNGKIAQMLLPEGIESSDVDRMTAFLKALVID